MLKNTFVAIGRIPGQCVIIHQEDLKSMSEESISKTVMCVVIDLVTGHLSEPITIEQLSQVCPFEEVTSMGEITVLSDLVVETLPEWKVDDLNKTFVRIRKPFNRLEAEIEPQPPKH